MVRHSLQENITKLCGFLGGPLPYTLYAPIPPTPTHTHTLLLGGLVCGAPCPPASLLEVAEQVPASLPQPLGHPDKNALGSGFLGFLHPLEGYRPGQEAWKNLEGGGWEQSKSNLELLLEINTPPPKA